jgi:hypothetical protein
MEIGTWIGFGVVDRLADAAEVDDFGVFCLYCCLQERS